MRWHFEQDLVYNYLELLTAVYKLAMLDARKGDQDAKRWLQETAPALDKDCLLTIRQRPPRRRVPKFIQVN